jgi:hypothetical protein
MDLQVDNGVSEKHTVSIFKPWNWTQYAYPKRRYLPAGPWDVET